LTGATGLSEDESHGQAPHPQHRILWDADTAKYVKYANSYLNAIALRLNQRPRKTLGFQTPADRLQAVLH